MIPAAAITRPSPRALEMIEGPRGLFDEDQDPYAAWRAPFRITAATLKPPGIEAALAVLATLAPADAIWLGWPLVDLGDARGMWRINASYTMLSPSRRVVDDPLFTTTTPSWFASYGWPRLPDGMVMIESGRRALLMR